MTVRTLLEAGNGHLTTVGPDVKIETVAARLHEKNIGAMPVVDDAGKLLGIISERDVVAAIARRGAAALSQAVRETMTSNVFVARADDSVPDVMKVMSARRIRHLPVMEGERVMGMISIRDLIRQQLVNCELEKNVLRDYAFARQ